MTTHDPTERRRRPGGARRGAVVVALAVALATALVGCGTDAQAGHGGRRIPAHSAGFNVTTTTTGTATPSSTPAPAAPGADTTTTTVPVSPPPPPPNCPTVTYPPGAPYQVVVSGTLSGALTIAGLATQGKPAFADDIEASVCGLLLLPNETSTIPPADIDFANPTSIIIPVSTPPPPEQHDYMDITPSAPSVASVSSQVAANGGLNLTINTAVETLAYLGLPKPSTPACEVGPVALTLSTAAPGGAPLTGPLQDATATLVASGFNIPASTDTSPRCGFYVNELNGLLNLPNDQTTMTATLHLSVSD